MFDWNRQNLVEQFVIAIRGSFVVDVMPKNNLIEIHCVFFLSCRDLQLLEVSHSHSKNWVSSLLRRKNLDYL